MKKTIATILAVCMLLTLAGCAGAPVAETKTSEPVAESDGGTWAIYWYLCGADLESEDGSATMNLQQLTSVELPENVTAVIETGGAKAWQNEIVSADGLQRFVYQGSEISLVDEQPSASMGDPETLASFLSYASENYPADHTMVIFWNHGGGSLDGVCFDELYDNDSLTLPELYSAFNAVYETSAENPPIDIVGFDACLMATVDTAFAFSDISRYLIASEETEPGNGWDYSSISGSFAGNPAQTATELGTTICDGFYALCGDNESADTATLSLIDLSKIQPLLTAYNSMGDDALKAAGADASFYSTFARAAHSAEKYGNNNDESGYTNLVDLGDLAANAADVVPETAAAISAALEDCVVYKVNGPYRDKASGLSCYYPYNMDSDEINAYGSLGTSESFKYLYSFEATGAMDEDGMAYLRNLGVGELPVAATVESAGYAETPVTVNDDGFAVIDLGPEANDTLASISFALYLVDGGETLFLGCDDDITCDWDAGVFTDNFRGVWGALDGNLVNMQLTQEGDGYNCYEVPILLNGEQYYMEVAFNFDSESWSILGASKGTEDGMAAKELYHFVDGDEITLVHYLANSEGDLESYSGATVTWNSGMAFTEETLPDGSYQMMFLMDDISGNTAFSQTVQFDIEGENIYTSVVS